MLWSGRDRDASTYVEGDFALVIVTLSMTDLESRIRQASQLLGTFT